VKLLFLAATLLTTPAFAADVWNGAFTAAQAARGKEVYMIHCAAACHVENLVGNGPAPSLAGPDFLLRWEDFTLAELLEKIRTTMPKAAPGSLSAEDYLTVTAFILSANGAKTGDTPLPGDKHALSHFVITARK
jgi:mono/diheme cytochrome c family protein